MYTILEVTDAGPSTVDEWSDDDDAQNDALQRAGRTGLVHWVDAPSGARTVCYPDGGMTFIPAGSARR